MPYAISYSYVYYAAYLFLSLTLTHCLPLSVAMVMNTIKNAWRFSNSFAQIEQIQYWNRF